MPAFLNLFLYLLLQVIGGNKVFLFFSGYFMQLLECLRFVGLANLGLPYCLLQGLYHFVVGLCWYGEGMTILATMRKGKTGRIFKSGRGAVYYLAHQGKRLYGSGSYAFQQEQVCKVFGLGIVGQ